MQNICDTKILHLHKNLRFTHECSTKNSISIPTMFHFDMS